MQRGQFQMPGDEPIPMVRLYVPRSIIYGCALFMAFVVLELGWLCFK